MGSMSEITNNLITNKRFFPLFLCQFLASFSDNFLRTAFTTLITYYAIELSDFSKIITITLALALFVLPFCLFSATGGKLADKYPKSSYIRWLKLSNIGVTIIAVIGFFLNSYALLLLSIFLIGLEASLFGPVKYSILPEALNKKDLLAGNSLIEAGTFIAILGGIIFGGMVVSNSFGSALLISIVLIGTSLVEYVAALFLPKSKVYSADIKIERNIIKETINSINFVKTNNQAFLAVLGISWFWLIGGVFISEMPKLTSQIFQADKSVFTMLLTIFSIGTGIGSLLCNRLLKNEISTKYVPTSMLVTSFFMFDLWWTSSIFTAPYSMQGIHYFLSNLLGLRAAVDILMISIAGGIYIVPLYTLLQISFDKTHTSQVIAANNIINSVFMVAASLLTIILTSLGVTVSNILFIMAATNLFTASYICRILPDTVIKNVLQGILKLIYRVEVVGMENYHKAGKRVLIIANHASFIDPLLLGVFLPGRHIFAIDTYFAKSWWLKPFLTFLRAYPIDPHNPMATKTLIDKLKNDQPVVIFPEGRITVTGSLMKIYEGPGVIADKAEATLLPVRLDGPQYSLFSRMKGKISLKLFPKMRIIIQEPQELRVPKHYFGRDRRHEIGNRLYDIMSEMMFANDTSSSTLFESLADASCNFGYRKVIISDTNKTSLSYGKLLAGSFILGKKFEKYIPPKQYIALMLPNISGAVVAFFGALLYSRIPTMINFSSGARNIIAACDAAQIKCVFTSHTFIERANLYEVVAKIVAHGIRIVYLEDLKAEISIAEKLSGIFKSFFPMYFFRKMHEQQKIAIPKPGDPAVVLFTSGSEGLPKGVVLSHDNLIANLKQLASRIDFTSSDKLFNALPIFHSFGLTGGMILPIICGVPTFFYPSPLHYRIIPEIVYGENATIFFATDTFLAGYAKYAHQYDFFSIRYIFAGAEKLKSETRKIWMEKFGIRILEGYGTTETAPAISVNTPMHCKLGTVGRFLPSMRFTLTPVEGITEGGRLVVSGPNVMLGYLRTSNPGVLEKTSATIDGVEWQGWYDTGDIVRVDEENYITIIGRAKRFAKIGGEMVSLAAIEELIAELWPEHLHAAVSINDEKKGESIILYTDYAKADKQSILQFLIQKNYPEIYIPKKVVYINEMPILGTGKIDYVALNSLQDTRE